MAIQLITFGGLHVASDSGELDGLLGQHARAALFVYLAIERRVSRESLTALFWPESDAENARHALRQSLYHVRKALGVEWVEGRAHDVVVTDDVRADAQAFTDAVQRGDLASAADLYRGPFLDGVHLVDLKPWETWVDSRRAQYARAFRKASRELIDLRRAAGDLTGAIELAERWTARDPSDDEAQHRLIEALAVAGERAEAIRQYETYARQLEPDGLQPLGETVALVERLRSESVPLPTLRSPAVGPMQAAAPLVETRPASTAASLPRSRTRWLSAVGVLLGVGLAAAWGLRQQRPGAVSLGADATRIVVLPFTVHGAQNVSYLGEGMVNLLGAALDGAGSLRPVDTRAVFAALASEGVGLSDRERADRVAVRLGTPMYVLGDVVEAGGQLQIEASVYRVGAGCAAPASSGRRSECGTEPNARATVSGAADSVFEVVDRLAARLLGGLGDPAADRLLRTAAVTTASLPAFKAYVQGEGLMRAGEFEQAADAYLAAIAQDSTFALAHYRLGLAREWAPLPGEDSAASAAARNANRLSRRDRALLEAFREWRAGDALEAERDYRAIVARHPDDIDAWFQLGEVLFHHGPLWGRRIAESEEAWRKVVSYEPRNLFAIPHLARIAVAENRLSTVDSLLSPFTQTQLRTDRRLTEIVLLRAVARHDTAVMRAVAKDVRQWEPFAIWRVAVFLAAFAPDPAPMRALIADLLVDFSSEPQRADVEWFASLLDLAGGRASVARADLAKAIESAQRIDGGRGRLAFQEVTEWYAATLPLPYADSTVMRMRREVTAAPGFAGERASFVTAIGFGTPIQLEPVRQYTLGVLSLRLRDSASAAVAAGKLERLAASRDATVLVRDLDRSLRARLAWNAGHADDALRLLQAMESRDSQGDVAATPFVSRANERYLRGELLSSLGRDAEALRWFGSLGDGSVTEIPLRAPSQFRQAEIYERLGNRDEAATHYTRFLELWNTADPDFQRMADSARARLAQLSRAR